MVKQQRALEEETTKVEEDLTAWCRAQAQMPPLGRVDTILVCDDAPKQISHLSGIFSSEFRLQKARTFL
jgi:hypothetical protein